MDINYENILREKFNREYLIELFNERNESINDFATAINVSPNTILRWLSGERTPYKKYVKLLASYFNVSFENFYKEKNMKEFTAKEEEFYHDELNNDAIEYTSLSREKFVEIWKEVFSSKDNIDLQEKFFDLILNGYEDERLKCWYYDDEVYLFDKYSFLMVNWYKLSHVGRVLKIVSGQSRDKNVLYLEDSIRDLFKRFLLVINKN